MSIQPKQGTALISCCQRKLHLRIAAVVVTVASLLMYAVLTKISKIIVLRHVPVSLALFVDSPIRPAILEANFKFEHDSAGHNVKPSLLIGHSPNELALSGDHNAFCWIRRNIWFPKLFYAIFKRCECRLDAVRWNDSGILDFNLDTHIMGFGVLTMHDVLNAHIWPIGSRVGFISSSNVASSENRINDYGCEGYCSKQQLQILGGSAFFACGFVFIYQTLKRLRFNPDANVALALVTTLIGCGFVALGSWMILSRLGVLM
jgi:hypothetical protein